MPSVMCPVSVSPVTRVQHAYSFMLRPTFSSPRLNLLLTFLDWQNQGTISSKRSVQGYDLSVM